MCLSLDKWESKQRFGGPQGKTWAAKEAVNCQAMWRKLSSKIETGDIIPFYAEYMDSEKITSPGFAMADVCVVYEHATSNERSGRKMKQVAKKPAHIIYTYISSSLTGHVAESDVSRLRRFLNIAFYDKSYALQCTVDAMSMALIGENVDLPFWSIGSGGVGKALFTSLIHNSISPMRGFSDCAALF